MGRFEPAEPRRTGRSCFGVARRQRGGQLSHTLLTLVAALVAGLDVGFLPLTVSTSAVGEWLQPLRS